MPDKAVFSLGLIPQHRGHLAISLSLVIWRSGELVVERAEVELADHLKQVRRVWCSSAEVVVDLSSAGRFEAERECYVMRVEPERSSISDGAAPSSAPAPAISPVFHVILSSPKRSSLGIIRAESFEHEVLGTATRRSMYFLARLYDPRFPVALEVVDLASSNSSEVQKIEHPLELVMIDGPRPDPKFCLQRLRALWLLAENRSGEIANDPVLPFRHQSALLQFLTNGSGAQRALIADEVGLGKTVEAGLYIRHILRQSPQARILYITPGGLVENVLEEFQRLDLPRWHFYANIDDAVWRKLKASPAAALTEDTRLVVASMHKLLDSNRWQEQRQFLGLTRFDLIIVDECHMLRAYGAAGDSAQVWFRNVRQLLQDHLVAGGRVLFLSATPHQGNREVFLNLVALCVGTPLNASEKEKADAARGNVIFRVKEQIRDWDGKRIFPPREVREPRLAEPPAKYKEVLEHIAAHFDWIAANAAEESKARTVGFVKSQALQFAASSLRAGFAYLLRRLIRYYPDQATTPQVQAWAQRLLPYRSKINNARDLLTEWLREFRTFHAQNNGAETEGELSGELGPAGDSSEVPPLLALLTEYDALFDDPEAGAKFNLLSDLVESTPEPIVVFSQAVDTVYELQARLEKAGYEVYRLTGDMDLEERLVSIRQFRTSDNPRRLLLSSAAGGIGINLQVARIVVHFDLPWNPMVLEQRVGRVHRIGSTRTILIETLLLRGSREAEVFTRITQRLQDIVRDLSADPTQREALFRRILASLDPEALRDILSGEESLDAVGAAVDAGRRAVDEADRYMQDLAAKTSEHRGRATMARLIDFVRAADPEFKKIGSRVYAVLTEAEGGELHQIRREADVFRFDEDDDSIVFDRTAASYLGLRRDQTGGLGHSRVDPLLRAAIDIGGEAKARTSSWVVPLNASANLQAGDIVYVALESTSDGETLMAPRLRAWRIYQAGFDELDDEAIEQFLWDAEFTGSRKAGDVALPQAFLEYLSAYESQTILHFPIAAIGIRERG